MDVDEVKKIQSWFLAVEFIFRNYYLFTNREAGTDMDGWAIEAQPCASHDWTRNNSIWKEVYRRM
jgi:hypothetical protein